MIPTLLLGRDCCRGRRHRRHGHNVFGPRRRREGHLERRERVALDAEEEGPVAAERVDERRLGVAFTAPCEAAEQFNVITNTAIADGVITDA